MKFLFDELDECVYEFYSEQLAYAVEGSPESFKLVNGDTGEFLGRGATYLTWAHKRGYAESEIMEIFVAEEHRRKGFGKIIFNELQTMWTDSHYMEYSEDTLKDSTRLFLDSCGMKLSGLDRRVSGDTYTYRKFIDKSGHVPRRHKQNV